MTYLDQADMANNQTLGQRVAQCAAEQGVADPDSWMSTNRRQWAAAPGWDAAWASAQLAHEDEPGYDPGGDEAVITDQMILSQVQSMATP